MDEDARHRLGLLLVTASAIAWSTAGFFTRLIPLDAWTMLVWRGLFGALGILLFVIVQERGKTLRSFRSVGWPGWLFALVSATGMMLFITSLTLTTVARVAIIYATVPFVAAGLGWVVMRERASASAIAASLAALAGVVIMVGFGGGEGSLIGDLLALGMTITLAVMMVIARRHQDIPILPAACLSSLLSALASLPLADSLAVSGPDLINLALFGLVNSAIGLALFTIGSRMIPVTATALIGSLDAPLAPIWVWLAFGETPSVTTILGGLVVFSAVLAHLVAGVRAPTANNRATRQ